MARRKESGIDVIAALPWPAGVILGLAGFWAVRYGAGLYFSRSGGQLGAELGRQLGEGSLAPLAWLVLAVCWIAAGVSYLRSHQRARLLQTRADLASIASLDWRQFEQLVGEAFRRKGYSIEETGQGGADGGIDLILRKDGRTTLVQCKRWRQRQVTVTTVREMWGLLAHHGAGAVVIASTGDYTSDARHFAEDKAIKLITGAELVEMIRAAQSGSARRAEPVGSATMSPSNAATLLPLNDRPACPKCSSEMMLRTNRQNGQQFWGCANYPLCRGTRAV